VSSESSIALTTLDVLQRPLQDLRISVTDRCNFRCPYCMPSEVFGERYAFLPKPEILRFEEIERLTRIFAQLGVRKLRITGGEPLLRAELPCLIERLAGIPGVEDLALTTNGVLLAQHAEALRAAGLVRVTVSLDALDEATFQRLSGRRAEVARVLDGIEAARSAGLAPIKINAVVIKGVNEHAVLELVDQFRGTGHILRLIEFMDVGTRNAWDRERVVSADEMLARIDAVYPLEPVAPARAGDVARRYRYRDGAGEIGIIASVSEPFCGGCTRARLSADGQLFTCLFGTQGYDLKALLRGTASDDVVRQRLREIWRRRSDRYSEERGELTMAQPSASGPAHSRVEMNRIGG